MSPAAKHLVALNADVVGYSRLLAEDREATTATLDDYSKLVADDVAANQGDMVNFVGDNFMAVFSTAEDAVRAGISIASAIEERNADVPSGRRLRFRMGIDEGEVSVNHGQYAGEPLNVAARIQSLAKPGGLSVSGRVYRALDEPSLRFRPLGKKHLKNIPEAVEIYEFGDLPTDDAPGEVKRTLSLEAPTLTVLPTETVGTDEQVTAASRLFRQELVHRLAAIPGLEVIDLSGENVPDRLIRYNVLPGVHQVGDVARVFASVVELTTFNIVKSHKWTMGVDEILARSEELADEVGRTVEVDLVVGAPAAIYADLGDQEAISKVYRGWHLLLADTRADWQEAVRLFEEVADSHPEFPVGHTLAAFANWLGATNDWGDQDMLLKLAFSKTKEAIEIGDPTGLGHMVRAAVLIERGRPEDALREIESAEIRRPTCDITFGMEGSVRRYLGEWEKAVDLTDVAMRLTGVTKPWYPTVQSCSLYIGGRHQQAADLAEMILEHHPHNLEALLVLAAAQVELGQERRARATAEAIRERFPATDVGSWLEHNPYQDPNVVKRWRKDLAVAGVLPEG